MNKNIILVAETGSDITPELAEKLGVYLVPMHVTMGDKTLDDGTFPAEDVCAYYNKTKKVPTTSGSTPIDFERVFDEIQAKHPGKQILHMAYSAVTTCSYHSATLAAENRKGIMSIDTKHVSVGQAVAVMETARYLDEHPDCTLEQAAMAAKAICERVQMCFVPNNLDYLRAGGRVSNATALVGNILGLHPCIEIIDGKLVAKKKYRGKLDTIIPKLFDDYIKKHSFKMDRVYLIDTPYLAEDTKIFAEAIAGISGFRDVTWIKTGCVITCHGGPESFGIVGILK